MAGFDPKQYRQQQAQNFSGTPAPTATPTAPKQEFSATGSLMKPFQDTGVLTTDRDEMDSQSVGRRVGEDAVALGLAPAALAATAVDLLVSPIDTAKDIAKGVAEGYTDMFSKEQWKRHPLLNTVNTIANVSIIGAPIKAALLRGARGTTINAAKTAALNVGANEVLVNNVFKPNRTTRHIISEAARLNTPEPVISHLNKKFQEAGVLPETAEVLARQVGEETFGGFLKENKPKLDKVEAFMHPISALGSKAGLVSTGVAKAIFGETEKSAVGKLYGSEIVKQDVQGFSLVEEWASLQVRESGLDDTVANRTRKIQDWVDENPEYQSLTPLERNKHFAEYAQADLSRAKFSETQKRDYVLTKALPKNYVEAIQDFIDKRPKVNPDGTPVTNGKIIEMLEKEYGKDFLMHSQEVRKRMQGNLDGFDRDLLKTSVSKLGDSRIPVSFERLSKAEKVFIDELEGTGYRIGHAPKGRSRVSQAVDVKGAQFAKEDLVAERKFLGRVIDNFGLSPEGNVEGIQFFNFRENLMQKALAHYGTRKNIVIDGAQYPVHTIPTVLDKLRVIQESGKSGVLPYNYTIADLRYNNLIDMGFSKQDAKVFDALIRDSVVKSPNIVGLGEALSNWMKTRNNPLSRTYNSFLRVQSDLRFKKNPMFAFQAAVETYTWSALFTKKVPGQDFVLNNLAKIQGMDRVIKNTIGQPTMREQAIVLQDVLTNYNRQLRDSAAPEIYRGTNEVIPEFTKTGVEGFREKVDFRKKNSDSNIWLGATGFSNVKIATNMMKAFARKNGMTLEEAMSFKMVDGKKQFNNPWLVQQMQDAATGVFGYHGTVLNSPLMRTLNTVFFPARFQTKSVIQTAKWLNSLSPTTRLVVMNQWVNTAEWLQTDEGEKWKKDNRGMLAAVVNYTFAYEGLGKTVDAVTKGELFGGNTGLIGGLPFGFIYNIVRDMGVVPEAAQIDPVTGKPFQREVQKDITSFPAFVKALESVIISMTPSLPIYTVTDGNIKVFPSRGVRTLVQNSMALLAGAVDPEKEYEDYKKEIERSEKKVKPQYTIFDK